MAPPSSNDATRLAVLDAQVSDLKASVEALERDVVLLKLTIAEQKPWVTLIAQLVVAGLTAGIGYWLGRQ